MVRLVHDLAEYEQASSEVHLTEGLLCEALFGESPKVFALVADDEDSGAIVGVAIWFVSYSTWTGRHGLYLEDLFVRPDARGRGVGRALLSELAGIAVAAGYSRLEWAVLDWNEPAIGFYRRLGATPLEEWRVYRLAGEALSQMAAGRC